ncbi:MAG: hypothetical protein NT094_05335, partial [Candidatus Staskawiczbacteria bacterium]|nr:hypothetical protein [Candidatus Staskawiczbacteria bacterium]
AVIFIVLVLFVWLSMSLLDVDFKNSVSHMLAKKTVADCNKTKEIWDKDACYEEVGLAQRDITICDKLSNAVAKDECYASIGLAEQNITICDKLQNQSDVGWCY